MSRRSYRELWQQLKVMVLHSKQRTYTRQELYELMTSLEVTQLAPEPVASMVKALDSMDKEFDQEGKEME